MEFPLALTLELCYKESGGPTMFIQRKVEPGPGGPAAHDGPWYVTHPSQEKSKGLREAMKEVYREQGFVGVVLLLGWRAVAR